MGRGTGGHKQLAFFCMRGSQGGLCSPMGLTVLQRPAAPATSPHRVFAEQLEEQVGQEEISEYS